TLQIKRTRAERLRIESERRFRLLTDTTPVMIWMTGDDSKCTSVNRAWLTFTGRTLEEELGDGWSEAIHEDDVESCRQRFRSALDRREHFATEHRLRRHDGEYRWMLTAGAPRFTPGGAFVGYTGSAIDITDQKLAKAALSHLSQALMQAQE